MVNGYFCYRPAFNPYFTPIVTGYFVTPHDGGGSTPHQPAISPRMALMASEGRHDYSATGPPAIQMWTNRTPQSVTVGGLIDVYDTDQ